MQFLNTQEKAKNVCRMKQIRTNILPTHTSQSPFFFLNSFIDRARLANIEAGIDDNVIFFHLCIP